LNIVSEAVFTKQLTIILKRVVPFPKTDYHILFIPVCIVPLT